MNTIKTRNIVLFLNLLIQPYTVCEPIAEESGEDEDKSDSHG